MSESVTITCPSCSMESTHIVKRVAESFEDGAAMLASELVANLCSPDKIGAALNTLGITEYDATDLTEFDQDNLKQIDGLRVRIHED